MAAVPRPAQVPLVLTAHDRSKRISVKITIAATGYSKTSKTLKTSKVRKH